jgi:hypothetical protein
MPKLKLTVDKLDDIAEPLRELYVKRDDKYELDVDGVPEMRAALKTANHEAATLRTKYKGIDPEEVATLQTQVEELRAKSGPEAIESVKQQLLTAHGKERTKLEARLGKLQTALERALIESAAVSAITAAKGSAPLLLPFIKQRVKMVERDDGTFEAQVVDEKGNPRVRDDGTPMQIPQLIEELRANEDFGRAFDGRGSAGSGMGGGGGGRATKKRSEMTVPEKAAYVEQHGNEAYLKLPY